MSDWDETRLRSEVSWQAFKEGKSLLERGRVQGLKLGEDLATAQFMVGKRRLRTVVRTGTQLDVECQCRENRSTGEVCAHAVAVVLAGLGMAETETPETETVTTPHGENLACAIEFPPGFERGLAVGRLSVKLDRVGPGEGVADAVLSQWIAANHPNPSFPCHLNTGGSLTAELLDALRDHPRLTDSKGNPLRIATDSMPPVKLAGSSLRGTRVHLELENPPTPIRWGYGLGWMSGALLGRAPVAEVPVAWRDEAFDLLQEGSLDLPLDEFIGGIDSWMDLLQAPHVGWLGEIRFRQRTARVELSLEGSLNALDAEVRIDTGKGTAVHDPETNTIFTTDRTAADRVARRMTQLGFSKSGSGYTLRDKPAILSFLADDRHRLGEEWTVKLGDRLSHVIKSLHVIRPNFDFGPQESLSCELSFQTDGGKVIPRAKVLEILRSGRDSVKTKSGAEIVVSKQVATEVEPLLADLGIVRPEGRLQLTRAQQECLRIAAGKPGVGDLPRKTPGSLGPATLRDYQVFGADWILDRIDQFGGALLADEMGLGKTIQTIACLTRLKGGARQPSLILMPTSLIGNWADELSRFTPELKVVVLHGPKRDALRPQVDESVVVITSYGTMVRDLAFHLAQDYSLVVADEASLLRNPDSEISRSVAKLKPGGRLALTGTPVENRLLDLWSIFRVVAPGYLGAKDEFLSRYEQGDAAETRRLRTRISPYVLRRTKTEVAKDLPERIETDQWLELGDGARALYREIATAGVHQWESLQDEGKQGAASMHLLTTLLRLRQICLDPALVTDLEESAVSAKTHWLGEYLDSRAIEHCKTLVFSQFPSYLRKLETEKLGQAGRIFRLDGSTRNGTALVNEFQKHEGPAVFLISLKAGGYGLNLTAADAVVHMDPWWNPAVEAQASDRAHRIGQSRPVSIHRLLIRDSVEERVRKLQLAKQAMISQITEDETPSNWSNDDLRSLIEL
ncbi:DEAD/DEAH box helicase [Haloferula rosea]|uniref:DEAD/DEAH box helicase n=1 Tax=Haloferula rosea TaxID=490093 RepID=A0A934RB69_9BACT|nr:DEAD/DEAH box helicase [Haloferula rosea]MBK1827423.1 DEAD/DEAH box helicase [Haloferula rosea]